MIPTRLPAVAGAFYPAERDALQHEVNGYLLHAKVPPVVFANAASLKALVVPHAGYVYSGPIAATGYRLLQAIKDRVRRVVLLGPAHRVWVPGLALPGVGVFSTPLGDVPLDMTAMAEIAKLPQVEVNASTHAMEHSLEVQLPFLQTVLEDFTLVPLVVGTASAEAVAEVLDRLWGGPETVIIVSSDLSHFLDYAHAQQSDMATAESILHFDIGLVGEAACGAHPLNGLLLSARRRFLKASLLDLRNSGDTCGDKSRVVGYGAFAFMEVM